MIRAATCKKGKGQGNGTRSGPVCYGLSWGKNGGRAGLNGHPWRRGNNPWRWDISEGDPTLSNLEQRCLRANDPDGQGRARRQSPCWCWRPCSMAAKEWPPLKAPGWAPLDIPGMGCRPGWWAVDQGVVMIQRDHVDWQWSQPG